MKEYEGVEQLRYAIVKQAYIDFPAYLIRLDKYTDEFMLARVKRDFEDILKFFHSRWYNDLCKIDRTIFLRQFRQQMIDYIKDGNSKEILFVALMLHKYCKKEVIYG